MNYVQRSTSLVLRADNCTNNFLMDLLRKLADSLEGQCTELQVAKMSL